MDIFKEKSMKLATGLDWNTKATKRHKGDTKRIHKKARRELKKLLTIDKINDIIIS